MTERSCFLLQPLLCAVSVGNHVGRVGLEFQDTDGVADSQTAFVQSVIEIQLGTNLSAAVGWGVAVFLGSIALAYACLRLYDLPVRAWLTRRFLEGKK